MPNSAETLSPLLLRPEEAARVLGIGRSRCYDLLRKGEIPSLRLGGSVRVPLCELEAWVKERAEAAREAGVAR